MKPIMKQASVADLRNKFERISKWIETGDRLRSPLGREFLIHNKDAKVTKAHFRRRQREAW